jgi:hypothetical protein
MKNHSSSIVKKGNKFTNTSFLRIPRWIPVAVLLLADISLLIMILLGGMSKVIAWVLLHMLPPLLGLISLIVVVLYAIIRRRSGKAIVMTGLVSLLSLSPAILNFVPVAYPASITSMAPSATVRLPANVPLKVAWGGDRLEVNAHVVVPDQRWAYDFVVEPYFTGSPTLTDYGCYGIPVVAPADAVVVEAHDGEPDMIPGVDTINYRSPKGNFIVLKLETEIYLIIAHLKPGSVLVMEGEKVNEGQVIGQCGNSGNSSEPHIHIHLQRQDPAIYPLNFAEGLPLYFRDHDGPPMPEGGVQNENGNLVAIGATVQHIGK